MTDQNRAEIEEQSKNIKHLIAERDKWQKLYQGLAEVVKRHETTIIDLRNALDAAERNNAAAEQAVHINKNLLRQMSEEKSDKEESLIEAVNKLKAKLRELGSNGDID